MKVVLLPGMDGSGILFKPLLQHASPDCDIQIVTYPDTRGQNYTSLTEQVFNTLPRNEDYVLVAESFAGPIAYHIAAKSPEHLRAVIFVATFLRPPRRWLLPVLRTLLDTLGLSYLPGMLVRRYLLGRQASSQLVALFRRAVHAIPASVLADRIKAIADLELPDSGIAIPCIYIIPTQDRLVPTGCLTDFESRVTDLTVHHVEGSHFILQSEPAACMKIIQETVDLAGHESTGSLGESHQAS